METIKEEREKVVVTFHKGRNKEKREKEVVTFHKDGNKEEMEEDEVTFHLGANKDIFSAESEFHLELTGSYDSELPDLM